MKWYKVIFKNLLHLDEKGFETIEIQQVPHSYNLNRITNRFKPRVMGLIKRKVVINVLIFISLSVIIPSAFAQDSLTRNRFKNEAANHKCFKCHGHKFYTYYNDLTEKNVVRRMNPFYVIDSVAFYTQNHCSFKCTDCHDVDYAQFPHNGQLQMEEMPSCLDCHEGDENTAKYHFEDIYKEYKASIHYKKFGNSFSCWLCHNPHKYKVTARKNEDISKVIIYDNEICLRCHSDEVSFTVLSDSANKNMIAAHDWLPYQKLHFQHVRCLDCHAKVQNKSMVDHDILPKGKAVKSCVDCHSKNTFLMASLYKFQSKERRSKLGFINASILNNSYVIGANRNLLLNKASLIIFGLVIVLLIIHGILRILIK